MAESSKSAGDHTKDAPNNNPPSSATGLTLEQIQAITRAARENPGTTNISCKLGPFSQFRPFHALNNGAMLGPPSQGVPGDVAMEALMEMEEEGLREELEDPQTTEEERVNIRQQLE
jgi:hypothetical protein